MYEVAAHGGVEYVRPRARTLHETDNWLVIIDYSNAFNTLKKTAVIAEVVNYVP